MHLDRIYIEGLRNIDSIDVRSLSRFNIIFGENGAGKTSFLEAIYCLGSGRSFRDRQIKSVITASKDVLTLFGEFSHSSGAKLSVSVAKRRDDTGILKVNHVNVSSSSKLAEQLPIIIMDPDMFSFLDGGPVFRRSFIDWGVFHMEHAFAGYWRSYQKALNQRNKLLKGDTIDHSELSVWTSQLVDYGKLVVDCRKRYIGRFIEVYDQLVQEVVTWAFPKIISYLGWSETETLEEALSSHLAVDVARGFTSVGPHRADLKFKSGRFGAEKVLSRGQQKMLIALARIAQGRLFEEETGRKLIYLVDDIGSELDSHNTKLLINLLVASGSQVFLTSLTLGVVDEFIHVSGLEERDLAMFHVKHGGVESINNEPEI